MHQFFCTKFQLDPSMRLQCERQSVRRNLNETLGARISKTDEAICVKIWYVDSPTWRASQQQIRLNSGRRSSELHRCENQVSFLPVNILMVWHALATTHYRMS